MLRAVVLYGGLFVALLAAVGVWASAAFSLESPMRSPLVVPAADCPNLPAVYRTNREYDAAFRSAAAKHWPAPIERNWCWLKAQCAAESALKPRVSSPVGAKGLCQFLDGTLAEVARQLGRELRPYDAQDSIEAAAVYVYKLRKQWSSPRPEHEGFRLAWASYNAGLGHILAAQCFTHGALLWPVSYTHLTLPTNREV